MEVVIRDSDRILLVEIFKKFEYWEVTYIDAGRIKILEWYNRASGRGVCIRTLDYMIARLKDAGMIKRTFRTKDMGEFGKQFNSSLTVLLPKGLSALEYIGFKAFDLMKGLRDIVKPRKKRAREDKVQRAQSGSAVPIGEVIEEVMKVTDES